MNIIWLMMEFEDMFAPSLDRNVQHKQPRYIMSIKTEQNELF